MASEVGKSWLLRLAVGLPVLAVLIWLQIARVSTNGLPLGVNVGLAIAGLGSVLLIFALAIVWRTLPAAVLRSRLATENPGGVVFVARTTPPQLKALRSGRVPRLAAYFVVVANREHIAIWSPGARAAPYASQPWTSVKGIRRSTACPSGSYPSGAIVVEAAGARITDLALIPSNAKAAFLPAADAEATKIAAELDALRRA